MSYPQEPIEHRNQAGDIRWQPRLRDGRTQFAANNGRGHLDFIDESNPYDMIAARGLGMVPRLVRTRRGAKRIAQRHEVDMAIHKRYHVWKPVT